VACQGRFDIFGINRHWLIFIGRFRPTSKTPTTIAPDEREVSKANLVSKMNIPAMKAPDIQEYPERAHIETNTGGHSKPECGTSQSYRLLSRCVCSAGRKRSPDSLPSRVQRLSNQHQKYRREDGNRGPIDKSRDVRSFPFAGKQRIESNYEREERQGTRD